MVLFRQVGPPMALRFPPFLELRRTASSSRCVEPRSLAPESTILRRRVAAIEDGSKYRIDRLSLAHSIRLLRKVVDW